MDPRPRAPRAADAAEIGRLAGELGYAALTAEIAERLAALAARPEHLVLVVDGEGGRLAGWIHVEARSILEVGARAEIVGLVVDAEHRRGGVGRALVAAAESWARERGLPAMVVRSNVLRDAAHPFYEARGFERIKTQAVYEKALGSD